MSADPADLSDFDFEGWGPDEAYQADLRYQRVLAEQGIGNDNLIWDEIELESDENDENMNNNADVTPEVVAALSQLTSVLSTPRVLSSTYTTSTRSQKTQKINTKKKTEKQVKSAEQEDIKKFIEEELMQNLPKELTVEDLCPLLSKHHDTLNQRMIGEKWKESHISTESFFENKTGFREPQLHNKNGPIPQMNLQKRNLLNFLNTTVNHLFFQQQKRGFKTVRSEKYVGTGAAIERSMPMDIFSDYGSKPKVEKKGDMFSDYGSKPKVEKKGVVGSLPEKHKNEDLELHFLRGFKAGRDDTSSSTRKNILRTFLIGAIIILGYNYFSAVGKAVTGSLGMLPRQLEVNPEEIHITFEDVKGADEAKQELKDVVEFLKDPKKFTSLGAKLPKGVLLVGPPGTGKTLLARAVAGEAGVPFFHASGSEFDEVFVGTGAKRVRQLFDTAKTKAPCVIFLDEIDSVGAKRTSSQIHPYANQTINQLLSEMDGFQQNEGIIVLGATNKRSNLDKAILRPGRFDVEVRVFPPDLKGRKDILELYLKKVKASEDINVEELARGTSGFTGAELENLVNQAALKAAIDKAKHITDTHIDFAKDKVMMGPAKKTRLTDEKTNWITAYHEAGHTIVAYFTKEAHPLHKVTIIPRGQALGFTAQLPEKDMYNNTKAQLLATMDVCMGGRVAEELIYGSEKVTTGASSDFTTATKIATAMVKDFGMSEKVGVRVFNGGAVDTGLSMMKVNDVSPAIQEVIDSEIKRILQESYDRAKQILKDHAKQHKELAQALMKYETLDKNDIKCILDGNKLSKT